MSKLRVESFTLSLDGFGAGPEMHIAIAPVLLGAGERLFEGISLPALGYACTKHECSQLATHAVFTRQ